MPSFASIAALTAFAAGAVAAPTPNTTTFRVDQVSVGKTYKNGPLQIAKTYAKFGKVAPDNVLTAAKTKQSGTVTATPEEYDEAYLCPVSVGTPAQTLMLDFDTGSSDLWVFSSLQPSSQRSGHSYYTPSSSSSSSLKTDEKWALSYGDGSGAEGIVYADTVVIGAVTATSQAVEAATSASSEFTEDTDTDGLLGLAFPKINSCTPKLCQPFVQNEDPTFPSKLFTADLMHDAAGSYDFGYIDTSKYSGSITYTKITKVNGFWEFTASGYSVGSTAYTESLDTIADTGTTLIYLPDDAVDNYYAQVSGAEDSNTYGGWVFPCSSTLPTLSITISGATYTVPAAYLNYAPETSSTCFGGLQSSDGIGINILGDVFLKSVFAVFDVGKTEIGFADKS